MKKEQKQFAIIIFLLIFVSFFIDNIGKNSFTGDAIEKVTTTQRPIIAQSNTRDIQKYPADICTTLKDTQLLPSYRTNVNDNPKLSERYLIINDKSNQDDYYFYDLGQDQIFGTADDKPKQIIKTRNNAYTLIFPPDGIYKNRVIGLGGQHSYVTTDALWCDLPLNTQGPLCANTYTFQKNLLTVNQPMTVMPVITIFNNKLLWNGYDTSQIAYIQYCDLTLNGKTGGCLLPDTKSTIPLTLAFGDLPNRFETTDDNAYLSYYSGNRYRIDIYNYASKNLMNIYDSNNLFPNVNVYGWDVRPSGTDIDHFYYYDINTGKVYAQAIIQGILQTPTTIYTTNTFQYVGDTLRVPKSLLLTTKHTFALSSTSIGCGPVFGLFDNNPFTLTHPTVCNAAFRTELAINDMGLFIQPLFDNKLYYSRCS